MMLGTAAIRSTTEVSRLLKGITPNSVRGAYSLMKRAEAMDTGTAMTRAMRAISTVPTAATAMPISAGWPCWGWGTQAGVVKNRRPMYSKAGQAWMARKMPMRARITNTLIPAVIDVPRNQRSPVVRCVTTSRGTGSPPGRCSKSAVL